RSAEALADPAGFEAARADIERDPGLAAWLDAHLDDAPSLVRAELLAWWRAERSSLLARLAATEPSARVPWYGPPMGALTFASARLMETWAHGQDVADALGVTRLPTQRLQHVAHLGVS